MNVLKNIKAKLIKPDGTLNGKIVSGLIGLLIILVQQVCLVFGFHLKGDTTSVVGMINTLLAVLGLLGVLSDPTPVTVPDEKKDTKDEK